MKKKTLPAIIILVTLIVLAMSLYSMEDSPPRIILEGDLNYNGIKEKYVLENFQLKIYEEGKVIWESPLEYKVDQMSIGDVTGDGKDNLAICVWKKGSFGKYRPFWHEGKDNEYKHHLFIYEFRDGTYKPKWFSSSLERPLFHMEITHIDDRDSFGKKPYKLLVVEGRYKKAAFGKHTIDRNAPKETKLWEWDQWGFSLLPLPRELDQEDT